MPEEEPPAPGQAGDGQGPGGAIELIELQEEMERSFLEYSMSVIVSRALPDVRDGLKPVHRRILYSMYEQNLRPDRPHAKCAKAVGEVMGNYHPHGDAAIYDALARMAQDFSLRHPLIDGHGNFGGRGPEEGPAAMRYTECRLAPIAMEMLAGIDEETIDFVPNYDATTVEPTVLPARFPNLLVNGSQGIAVGMATNIPPHNLGEVIDAVVYVLDHPDATPDDLLRFVQGPDFPTGALILGRQGILDAARTGRGSIKLRAVAEIEERRGTSRIVVTDIPFQTSVEAIEQKIGELVEAGTLEGIADTQNDSHGGQPRLVIQLKRDANPNVVLNNLFKHTPLQTNFPVNMVALVDGVPRTLNLAQLVGYYVDHQIEVVTRRSRFRLDKAERRAHIVEGLLRAIDMLDAVIAAIRAAEDRPAARTALCSEPFSFSEEQAEHILDMTLARLTRLGRSNLEEELAELRATIAELQAILADDARLRGVIGDELRAIRDRYADPRRTRIVHDPGELSVEDLVADDPLVVTMTRAGYVKAVPASSFRTQARGGRGVQGAKLKDEDLVTQVVHTSALSHLLLFSNRGRVYRLRGHEVPVKDRSARGTPVVNLLPLEPGERIQAVISTRELDPERYLLFCTKDGQVKKTALAEYDKSRREGFIAIALRDGDELVRVVPTSGEDDLLLVSRSGMAIRFNEAEVRPMGRDAAGVRGMRLKPGDDVVSCDVVRPDADLLVVTDAGYGKRTKVEHFPRQGRGGQGVRAIRLTARRGEVVGALMAALDQEVLVVSSAGVVIRTAVRQVAAQGRDATGVRLMSLDDDQRVAAVALVVQDDED
ncbi:DNA gyrase subunit A [Aciditerrimonas ferrireducens]|uniref:DNA gyrase subunit A n=1 Tax=Aciditerrimonas ferrireducens TaxID=667306 RepID=UPI002005049A|nr:DNA gyrase subunit A [Aciditerrimonas ferrireducens]MCK4176994.1 DNA gyrase subunit A [Aciditerrimonas ferrireducens]